MRAILILVAALMASYFGYWFLGEHEIETRAAQGLADLRARGWLVDYAALDTTGFPSLFDTTITDLRLADPAGRVSWSAPTLRAVAQSYHPNRVIVLFPPAQVVEVMGRPIDVATDALRASAAVGLSTDLPFDHAELESGPLRLTGEGWGLGLQRVLLAARRTGTADAYDLYLDAEGFTPEGIDATIDLVRLDATLTLDAPLDRRMRGAPLPRALHLKEARVGRGAAVLTATGDLATDDAGVVGGEIRVVAEGYPALLDLMGTLGVDFATRLLLRTVIGASAPVGERAELTVTFSGGRVLVDGIDLGAAPILPQRR